MRRNVYHSLSCSASDLIYNLCTSGDLAAEKDTLAWRLASDLSLISDAQDRSVYPLCKYLRKLAVEQGIGQLDIEDHELKQRFHPVAYLYLHVMALLILSLNVPQYKTTI